MPKFKKAVEDQQDEKIDFSAINDMEQFKEMGGIIVKKPKNAFVVMIRNRSFQYYGWSTSPSVRNALDNDSVRCIRMAPPLIIVQPTAMGKMFVVETCENIKHNSTAELGEDVRTIYVPITSCDFFSVADHFEETFKQNCKSEGIWIVE
jgi:hypothetical protein